MGRPKKTDIPIPTVKMDKEEIAKIKLIGDAIQSVEKSRIQKIKAEEAARNLVETKAVINLVTDVFTKLKSIFYSSANKLPARITGKSHAEVSQIMFEFIDETFERCMSDFDNKIKTIKVEEESEDEIGE